MKAGFSRIIFFLILALLPSISRAAQMAVVDSDDIELHEGPGKKYPSLMKVPKGTKVQASNITTEGYYKVRVPNGRVGWLPADSLILSGAEAPAPPATAAGRGKRPQNPSVSAPGPAGSYPAFRFSILGGFSLFNVSEVNNLLQQPSLLKNGYHFGAQMIYPFRPDLGMVLRFEKLAKSVVGTDTGSKQSFQFDLSSIPVMAGIDYEISRKLPWIIHFDLMLGLAPSTQLISTALNQPTPNASTYTGTGFAGLVKFDAQYEFARHVNVFSEVGYRYLRTSSLSPTLATNGGQIFKDNNQNPMNVTLDMSGIVLDFGIELSF